MLATTTTSTKESNCLLCTACKQGLAGGGFWVPVGAEGDWCLLHKLDKDKYRGLVTSGSNNAQENDSVYKSVNVQMGTRIVTSPLSKNQAIIFRAKPSWDGAMSESSFTSVVPRRSVSFTFPKFHRWQVVWDVSSLDGFSVCSKAYSCQHVLVYGICEFHVGAN